jgi:hypothetical protein
MTPPHSTRKNPAALALTGLALAGGGLWWSQREQPAPEAAIHARAETGGARRSAERPRVARAAEAPVGAAATASTNEERADRPAWDPPLAQDRPLVHPHLPSAAGP